jgi:hypothetical protein
MTTMTIKYLDHVVAHTEGDAKPGSKMNADALAEGKSIIEELIQAHTWKAKGIIVHEFDLVNNTAWNALYELDEIERRIVDNWYDRAQAHFQTNPITDSFGIFTMHDEFEDIWFSLRDGGTIPILTDDTRPLVETKRMTAVMLFDDNGCTVLTMYPGPAAPPQDEQNLKFWQSHGLANRG